MGEKRKRRFGDRYDGRLLRSIDPLFKMVPYIMKERSDSQTFFYDEVDITADDALIKKLRSEGNPQMRLLYLFIAAYVRVIAKYPALNRFIAGRKIYARNKIQVSMTVKKELRIDVPETTIKLDFTPESTLNDIVDGFNAEIEKNKGREAINDTDKTAKSFSLLPGFFIRFLVWFLTVLDNYGKMPKILLNLSPFHTSMFITDLGSLGIDPVYHHLYNFGTTSIFIAIGTKKHNEKIDDEGERKISRYITIRIVTDERICDGHQYAAAFKYFKYLMKYPEELLTKPDVVNEDID